MKKLCSWPHCDNFAVVNVREAGDKRGLSVCNKHAGDAAKTYKRLGYKVEIVPLDPKMGTKPIHQEERPANVIDFPLERTRRDG